MKLVILLGVCLVFLSSCTLFEPVDTNETIFKDYNKVDRIVLDNSSNIEYYDGYNVTSTVSNEGDFLIGSFNIKDFNDRKASSKVLPFLQDIIDDYDILAIQGIRDSSDVVIGKLNGIGYHSIRISPKFGASDEQYVFVFSDRVISGKSGVYPDDNNVFRVNPFVMNFVLNKQSISFIQVKIDSSDAEQEIRSLSSVVEWTENNFGNNNIYILGDLSADCVYFDSFSVLKDYVVLINDSVDTTIGISDCAYDRILGTEVDNKVLSAGVDNLSVETSNNFELLEAISNHYPVFMVFQKV